MKHMFALIFGVLVLAGCAPEKETSTQKAQRVVTEYLLNTEKVAGYEALDWSKVEAQGGNLVVSHEYRYLYGGMDGAVEDIIKRFVIDAEGRGSVKSVKEVYSLD